MEKIEKLNMCTPDGVQTNIEKIATLFPDCVTEAVDPTTGKTVWRIDRDKLLQNLSADLLDDREERYQFTWPDKRNAIRLANTPTSATLRPVREESVDFDNTKNLYIEGDNLDVLKLLKTTYLHSVKMIYIDPPYNTGNDFVFKDDFTQSVEEYREKSGQYDEQGNRLFVNTESNGRFHTDWLNMIYPRLRVARDLLADDGVIFISIDDNEVANLKKVCDEIFGEGNFVAQIVWQSTAGSNTGVDIITVTENILVYSKNRYSTKINVQPVKDDSKYNLSDEYETKRGHYVLNKLDRRMTGPHYSEALNYPITAPDGINVYPGGTSEKGNENWNFRWSKDKVAWGIKNGFIVFKKTDNKWNIYFKQYFKVDNCDNPIIRYVPYQNLILSNQFNTSQGTVELFALFANKYFDYAKPVGLLKHLIQIGSSPDSLVLDFFSGSATTAHAVMQLNAEDGGHRRYICVQLPEETGKDSEARKAGYATICEIGKERIRRAGAKIKADSPLTTKDLDTGFRVLRLDSSNMEDVYYTPAETVQGTLFSLVDNVKADRTAEDLLFQVMLELGITLDSQIEKEEMGEKNLWSVHYKKNEEEKHLIACFDKGLTDEVVKVIAQKKPTFAVLCNNSIADDQTATNFEQIFRTYTPDTTIKIL